jgi:hypothetical protein
VEQIVRAGSDCVVGVTVVAARGRLQSLRTVGLCSQLPKPGGGYIVSRGGQIVRATVCKGKCVVSMRSGSE